MLPMGFRKLYVCNRCGYPRGEHIPKLVNGNIMLTCGKDFEENIPPTFTLKTGYIKSNGKFIEWSPNMEE